MSPSDYPAWKDRIYQVLKQRFDVVQSALDAHPEYGQSFEVLPFNSGYFLCVQPRKSTPDIIRRRLLDEYDTGLIATAFIAHRLFLGALR